MCGMCLLIIMFFMIQAANQLDSSAPAVKRGKEREEGKPKKLSKMKKVGFGFGLLTLFILNVWHDSYVKLTMKT